MGNSYVINPSTDRKMIAGALNGCLVALGMCTWDAEKVLMACDVEVRWMHKSWVMNELRVGAHQIMNMTSSGSVVKDGRRVTMNVESCKFLLPSMSKGKLFAREGKVYFGYRVDQSNEMHGMVVMQNGVYMLIFKDYLLNVPLTAQQIYVLFEPSEAAAAMLHLTVKDNSKYVFLGRDNGKRSYLLDRAARRVVIVDEAMGAQLMKSGAVYCPAKDKFIEVPLENCTLFADGTSLSNAVAVQIQKTTTGRVTDKNKMWREIRVAFRSASGCTFSMYIYVVNPTIVVLRWGNITVKVPRAWLEQMVGRDITEQELEVVRERRFIAV